MEKRRSTEGARSGYSHEVGTNTVRHVLTTVSLKQQEVVSFLDYKTGSGSFLTPRLCIGRRLSENCVTGSACFNLNFVGGGWRLPAVNIKASFWTALPQCSSTKTWTLQSNLFPTLSRICDGWNVWRQKYNEAFENPEPWPPETSTILHRSDCDCHLELTEEETDLVGDQWLPGSKIRILSWFLSRLEELGPTQPLLQQVLCENPAWPFSAVGQGQLLDSGVGSAGRLPPRWRQISAKEEEAITN